MGLLDDAIRDHLDLKRRRGADPAEIERAEREALGPVRREPVAPDDGAESPLTSSGLEAAPPGAELPGERSGEPVPGAEGDGEDFEDESAADEDWDDYEDDEYEYEDEEDDGSLEAHPRPGPSPRVTGAPDEPRRHHPDDDLDATQVHEMEPAGDSEGGTEDVLEETPDFLQDTPDHDRLWFEQRPPRDFDFEE